MTIGRKTSRKGGLETRVGILAHVVCWGGCRSFSDRELWGRPHCAVQEHSSYIMVYIEAEFFAYLAANFACNFTHINILNMRKNQTSRKRYTLHPDGVCVCVIRLRTLHEC